MGLKELEEKRAGIIDKHMHDMIQINKDLVRSIDNGLKERTTGVDVNFNALEKIKALIHIGTDKGLKMTSEQRLELAKLYFDLQKTNIVAIMADRKAGYESELGDISKQITRAEEKIEVIEEELRQVKDPDRSKSLIEQIEGAKRAFPEL
jgi:hypothetical protein